jgi:hypothetical protein
MVRLRSGSTSSPFTLSKRVKGLTIARTILSLPKGGHSKICGYKQESYGG